jgi:HEAT repeat protein
MNRHRTKTTLVIALLTISGCNREDRGPVLAGGREVKWWLADLRDPKPQVRRQAVLKLGNVGDTDPTVAEGLAEALRDSDAIVHRDAVSAIAKLSKANEEIMAWLRIMSDRDSDPRVRDYAKRALISKKFFDGVPRELACRDSWAAQAMWIRGGEDWVAWYSSVRDAKPSLADL